MCGVVFADGDSRVTVGLMNLKSDEQQQFRQISVDFPNNLITRPSDCWAFTVVGSKLFATRGRAHKAYYCGYGRPVLEVYFCDLRDAFTTNNNSNESLLEFKVATTLKCPKTSPLAVPYKDKIFFIANPCVQVEDTPCEVLHLGDGEFNVKPLTSHRFWQGRQDPWREHTGHVVVRNKLYVCVVSRNKARPTLYCLDMDAEVWEAKYRMCIPHIVKQVYQYEEKQPWNYVYGDKHIFKLEMDKEDPSIFSLRAEIWKEDGDGDVCKVKVDLKGLVDFMGLKGCYYICDGWVLPCEEKISDTFCLMFWIRDLRKPMDKYLCICKFKLADDGSFSILTRRVIYVPIPLSFGSLMIGFTPGISEGNSTLLSLFFLSFFLSFFVGSSPININNKSSFGSSALNAGQYSIKFFKRDRARQRNERKEANREKAKIEEAKLEEAKREYARREDEKRALEEECLYLGYIDWALEAESNEEEEVMGCESEEEAMYSEEERVYSDEERVYSSKDSLSMLQSLFPAAPVNSWAY
ncbi:hypothetical protein LINGRAHAP2_LOCUS1926 [Linum grandiflorum]